MMTCQFCEKKIKNSFNLEKHIKQIHLKEYPKISTCTICKKDLETKNDFYKNGYKGYNKICKTCTKNAVDKTIINCPICEKKTYKRNLRRHQTSSKCVKKIH